MFAMSVLASAMTAAQDIPSAAQKENLERTVAFYFNALDTGAYAPAREIFVPPIKQRFSLHDFTRLHSQTREIYGQVVKRNVTKVEWRPKGANASTGMAVIVYFHGAREQAQLMCGLLIFLEIEPAAFLLWKDDTTYLGDEAAKGISSEDRRKLLDRPGCRGFLTD